MNDRELLELAAKAAGIKIRWQSYGNYFVICDIDDEGIEAVWNPILDDGDALRLAIKLNMGISIPVMAAKYARVDVITFRNSGVNVIEACKDDPCAATRLAIVRAAAEIGRNL